MISCQQYDYIEIACLYQLPIKLTLLSGEVIEGKVKDTRYTPDKKEAIVITTDNGEQLIATEELCSMQAMVSNPHFEVVDFSQHK